MKFKGILITVIVLLVLGLGGYLLWAKVISVKINNFKEDFEEQERINNIHYENYDFKNIENIVITLYEQDSETLTTLSKDVAVADIEEMQSILDVLDVANIVGMVQTGIDFESDMDIMVNYKDGTKAKIILASNGNVLINYTFEKEGSGFVQYALNDSNFEQTLKDRYFK